MFMFPYTRSRDIPLLQTLPLVVNQCQPGWAADHCGCRAPVNARACGGGVGGSGSEPSH